MKNIKSKNRKKVWLVFGAFFGFSLLAGAFFGLAQPAGATPALAALGQTDNPFAGSESCQACHLDLYETWQDTLHAQAFSSKTFQETWEQQGSDPACLQCHTTGYDPTSQSYAFEGVICESCHGAAQPGHPQSLMSVEPNAELCASCHAATSGEWHTPPHEDRGVDCQVCHNPHAQTPKAGAAEVVSETSAETAASAPLDQITGAYMGPETCQSCHQELYDTWQSTRHAQAFSSPIFQRDWVQEGSNAFCLECHTTGFDPITKDYAHEGVSCESCHGPFQTGHPQTLMAVEPNAELCATCHKTTTDEWRASKHGHADIQCQACHNPHSQSPRAESITELCTNCHKTMVDSFTHGTHAAAGLECSNCHMYTGPRTEDPIMGLVATGHTFSVGSDTCIGCHKDTVHTRDTIIQLSGDAVPAPEISSETLEQKISAQEMTIQALEARGSVRLYTGLAQGAIVGLVTGGVAAWVISRRIQVVEEDDEEEDEDEQEENES